MVVVKAIFSWIMKSYISTSHGGEMWKLEDCVLFGFYLLDFDYNHVIQKPKVQTHLAAKK